VSIVITDETASAVRLTIDNSGFVCLGSGVPVAQLTADGIALVDSSGLVTNTRVVSNTVQMTTGTVFGLHSHDTGTSANVSATISTTSGRQTNVFLESPYPAKIFIWQGPTLGCAFTAVPQNQPVFTVVNQTTSGFQIQNNNTQDTSTGHGCSYDPVTSCNYYWI